MILAGSFEYFIDSGCEPMTSLGGTDMFLFSLDYDGLCQWSRQFGDSGDQYAEDLCLSPFGEIGLTGFVQYSVDFGGGSLTCAGLIRCLPGDLR